MADNPKIELMNKVALDDAEHAARRFHWDVASAYAQIAIAAELREINATLREIYVAISEGT